MAVIEQRYAQALVALVARDLIPAEQLRRELGEMTAAVESSSGLQTVLASPAVDWRKKLALLDVLCAKAGVSRITRNFLVVAAQRGRISHLAGMDRELEALLLEREGVVKAEVSSARELAPAERAAIERELTNRLSRKLRTHFVTDPDLVGGFIARVGDQVFDGSIRGRLQRLAQALTASA